MEKVLVLDWDVHHGNGIEEILYGRADIMYISLHRCLLMTLQPFCCIHWGVSLRRADAPELTFPNWQS